MHTVPYLTVWLHVAELYLCGTNFDEILLKILILQLTRVCSKQWDYMHVFSKTYEYFEDNICIRTDTTLSYLDVSISICQGKFITEVFDKWDNF